MNGDDVVIGIDLGTTFSLVSIVSAGTPVVLPNALGERLTPSVVGLDDEGRILVGAAAAARLSTHPNSTRSLFKRDMGTTTTHMLGGKNFRAEDLSALVLRQLKEDAEAYLGKPVREAVVTVPAYFGELQRRSTKNACEIAGLHVERLLNEPTAAALAFGLHQMDAELKAIVLDLGGGTFDVTALEILEGVIEIQSSAGDSRLGGEDFTEALVDWSVEELKRRYGNFELGTTTRARLREACEGAKRSLSTREETSIVAFELPLGNERKENIEVPLTRATASAIWAPTLKRIEGPIHRALLDAKWKVADVDQVIVVGGATRMFDFVALATQLFGKLPQRHLPPDEAVAMGAGIQAALKSGSKEIGDLVVTDVAPFTLGMEVLEKIGSRHVDGVFLPILERGTVLPASRMTTVNTVSDRQTHLKIKVFQGESSQCSKNQRLGEFTMAGLPPGKAGDEAIDVRFTYDLNGILEVESTIRSTGKKSSLVIEKSPGALSKEEVEKARRAMERLKFHPREALPNVTALSRADALYAELRGDERRLLAEAIATFRAALDSQEEDFIREARSELIRYTEIFRSSLRS